MSEPLKGTFRLGDQQIDYQLQMAGNHKEVVAFTMKFNKVPVKAEQVFVAGIYLMHYLANDYGIRIDIEKVRPELPDESEELDSEGKEH